jgi:hypothetical protein
MAYTNPYVILSKHYQSTAIVPDIRLARKFQTGYGRRVGSLIELTVNDVGIWFTDIENLTQKEKELAGVSH